jgi:hypothetical protein
MEKIQHFEAMPAFCTQRSKMEGENELFWLTEAEVLERLAINAERMRLLGLDPSSIKAA